MPANYNTIGQIVISGDEVAVEQAGKLAKESGAKKVMILNTARSISYREISKMFTSFKRRIKTNINKYKY